MEVELRAAGYPLSDYQGQSFRIAGATSLAQNGVPISVIDDIMMGGWVRGSLALPRYLRDMTTPEIRREMFRFFSRP